MFGSVGGALEGVDVQGSNAGGRGEKERGNSSVLWSRFYWRGEKCAKVGFPTIRRVGVVCTVGPRHGIVREKSSPNSLIKRGLRTWPEGYLIADIATFTL